MELLTEVLATHLGLARKDAAEKRIKGPLEAGQVPHHLLFPHPDEVDAAKYRKPSTWIALLKQVIEHADRPEVDQIKSLPLFFPHHVELVLKNITAGTWIGFEEWFIPTFTRFDLEVSQSNMLKELTQSVSCHDHLKKLDALFLLLGRRRNGVRLT